jgi:S1-C subfamily serine protease
MTPALADFESAIGEVAEAVRPSVVGIGGRGSAGSGVVVDADTVVTNAHNLRGEEAVVTFEDGRTETGRIKGTDVDGDLSVISVPTQGAAPIQWSESSPALGSSVFALANPGGRGFRVTVGFVSGAERSFRGPRGRRISGGIEHTAPLLPGSSGGPVVDASGRLLGINTHRIGEGFYLAIPANADLKRRIEALSRGETPARPRLGVGLAPSYVARRLRRAVGLSDAEGVLVRFVEEDSPAEKAGIREGDLIFEAAGGKVDSVDDLHTALGKAEASGLSIKVLRGNEEAELSITLE